MRNEYLELRIANPASNSLLYPDAFRGRVRDLARQYANADRPYQIPVELFHKTSDGSDRSDTPGIRFGGGKGAGRIQAVGDEAVDLLDRVGHKVTRVLADAAGTALKEDWRTGRVQVTFRQALQWYRIPAMVVQKPGKGHGDLAAAHKAGELTNAMVAPRVEAFVRRGIAEQADLTGLDYDPDFLIGSISYEWAHPLPVQYGREKAAMLVLKNVHFAMNLDLSGPWHAGYMRARGFGRLQWDRKANLLQAAS